MMNKVQKPNNPEELGILHVLILTFICFRYLDYVMNLIHILH